MNYGKTNENKEIGRKEILKKEKFGLVLWHFNHSRLFNAKYYLYILLITFLNEPELTFYFLFFAHSLMVSSISL